MHNSFCYQDLSDADLRSELTRVLASEREATVRVVTVLVEIERRQLYLEDGYPSLYVYCIECHHLSEPEAYARMTAARAALKWPRILRDLQDGSLSLTAVVLLKPHLTDDNCDALLAEARHQPKRVVERMIARLAPRADAPSRLKPTAPGKYRFEVTIDEETHELILQARELLLGAVPDGNLAAITKRAYQELVRRLLRRKAALVDRPRLSRGTAEGARAIPADIRREVWTRDGGRCAFEGPRGRCPVSGAVDFHHIIPFALGGPATAENIELRCRAHNLHQARKDGLGWKKGDVA